MTVTSAPRSGGRSAAPPKFSKRGTATPTRFPTQGTAALRSEPGARPEQVAPLLKPDSPAARPLLVAPPLPVMVPRAPFIALVLVLVVGGVLGILVLNTKINENAFKLHDLRQRQATLDRRQSELEQRLADYQAPNNLAARACTLGLVPADGLAFLRLPGGQVIGTPRPAAGDQCVSSRQASGAER